MTRLQIEISEILQDLIDNGGKHAICYTMYNNLEYDEFLLFEDFIKDQAPSWEHFSGISYYPIPYQPHLGINFDVLANEVNESQAESYYYWCEENSCFWDGEAGILRKSLCQHLLNNIHTLEE